jgi:hypothetical protein
MIMNPPDENTLLLQAISLARTGRKEDAHALLHKIIGENPHSEMAWLWLVQTEPDPAQQILILEECLRNNPKSDYAKKGLASLRAQMGAHPAHPPKQHPTTEDSKPRKPTNPSRGPSGIWKIIFVVMLLAVLSTLVAGGILLFPLLKDKIPAIHLPNLLPSAKPPTVTMSSTPPIPSMTRTIMASLTPTVTRTRTATFTPSLTLSPTVSPTPTLFLGTPVNGEYSLLFMKDVACEAVAVPVSGGPETLTTETPVDCTKVKISPDGTRIGFVGGPNREILQVVNVDGTNSKSVLRLSKGTDFDRSIWDWQWSPNGKKIALVAPNLLKETPGFLYTGFSDGSGALKSIKNGGIQNSLAFEIQWSPDSQWIFAWDSGLAEQIPYPSAFRESDSRSVVLADLKSFTELTPYFHFDWSPDSRFLSFIATQKPVTDALPTEIPETQAYLVIAGLDKTLKYIPLPAVEGGFDPFFGALWSPDASAFLLLDKGTNQLALIGNDGRIKSRPATLQDSSDVVQWSPDGKWISIVEAGTANDTGALVEIVRPDGTDFRILATGAALQPIVWK